MKIIPPKQTVKEMRRKLAFTARTVAEGVAKLCIERRGKPLLSWEHSDKMFCMGAVGAAWFTGALDDDSYHFLIAVLLKEADPDEQRAFIKEYGPQPVTSGRNS